MTLDQWLSYASTTHKNEISLGLKRINTVATALNLLPMTPPVITIAGTNGKGSTVAMLEAIYTAAGYKTCSITSPHLFKFNERLKTNGTPIDDASLCNAFERVNKVRGGTPLTYYEFTLLACLLIAKEAKPDVMIIEVGLGGRLDGCNIIDPTIAVITSIDLDHQQFLGNTREDIGREKAGILRKDIPFIYGDLTPPSSVITLAKEKNCQSFYAGQHFTYERNENHWQWQSENKTLKHLPIPNLLLQNAATVLMTIETMQNRYPIEPKDIKKGLQSVFLAGRFEVTPGEPTLIFDVAHNPASSAVLANNLRQYNAPGEIFAVFSILKDKDIPGTIAPLLSCVDHWFIAPLQHVERACSIDTLKTHFDAIPAHTMSDSLLQAFERAKARAKPKDIIVIFGSFYTVAALALRP